MIDEFQDGGRRVMFVQVKIAEGFNLTRSQDAIFFGRDWSPAVNAQAGDRLHRIGQTGTVNIQIPIMRKTFEEYLNKKLAAKERDAEQSLRTVTIGELRKAL
jgi:SNF2 family DNA or RNA helicase